MPSQTSNRAKKHQTTPTKTNKKDQNERLSLGPEEFRDTVRSFENLSKTKDINNQITLLINTSRTEPLNQSINTKEQNISLENQESSNIHFSLGTYSTHDNARASSSLCKPNTGEAFKHRTPTDEDSERDSNEEVQIESEEDTFPDLKALSQASGRTLRSNSQSH